MSLHKTDLLSIWEVAHRWEGVKPEVEGPGEIPSKVRDRLRNLGQALAEGLFCYDEHWQLLDLETRTFGVIRKTNLGRQLDEAVKDPKSHEQFLKTVLLHRYHVETWYTGREILPEFWFAVGAVNHSRKVLGMQ